MSPVISVPWFIRLTAAPLSVSIIFAMINNY
jgi:hypothetical protein